MDIKLKLSEAIRQGAALRPMCKEGFFGYDDSADDTMLCSCAMGAAYEATIGYMPDYPDSASAAVEVHNLLLAQYPELNDVLVDGDTSTTLRHRIAKWNDSTQNPTTREDIADRVAALGY